MKKIAKLFAVACAFAATVSCAKEMISEGVKAEENLVPFTVEASFDATKATVNGLEVVWQAGDKIAVFDGTAKREFTIISGAGTKTAVFEGEIAASATKISAVAPFSAAGDEAGEYIIPEKQQLSSSTTIDPAAVVMVAGEVAKGSTLAFKNPCGIVRMTVPAGTTMTYFGVEGFNVEVGMGSVSSSPKTLDVVVPAYDHNDVFVGYRTSEGTFAKTSDKVLSLKAGSIVNLGDVTGNPATIIRFSSDLDEFLKSAEKKDAFIVNDLDLQGTDLVDTATIAGVFDGRGHSIKHWKPAPLDVKRTGALVAMNKGVVKNIILDESCTFKMIPVGNNSFVVLENQGIVSNCVNNADIQIVDFTGTSNAGAIVAKQTVETAKTIDCYNNGNFVTPEGGVTVGGQLLWGGIIGRLDKGQVIDCVNNGEIVVNAKGLTANYYLGGVVGFFDNEASAYAAVEGCSNTGTVKIVGTIGKPVNLGGVVGASKANVVGSAVNYGIVKNCFNSGNVVIDVVGSGYSNVGGVVGYLEGDIEGCYATESSYVANIHNPATAVVRTAPSAGGVVGRLVFSGKNCSNAGKVVMQGYFSAGTDNKAFVGSTGAPVIGGVFGCAGKAGEKLTGCVNTSSKIIGDVKMGATNATALYIGGVAGAAYSNVSSCSNSGNLTLDKCQHKTARFGGVVGYLVGTASESVNDGNLTLVGLLDTSTACSENSGFQYYLGGIAGNQAGAVSNSVNNGRIYFKQARNSTAFSYIGGISGTASASVTGCTNNGEVASSSASNVRIAGISGLNSNTVENCVNAGQIVVENATAAKENYRSAIAGIVGHTGANLKSNVNSGDVKCVNCADSICVALLAGTVGNSSKEWNGNTISGAITASNCKTIGYLLGGQITLTSPAAEVAVKVGNTAANTLNSLASINGVEATAADCTNISKLVGYLQSGYESCFILSEGGVTFTDPVLAYAGETYKIVKLEDGKWWMAENLRYVPKGVVVSENGTDKTAKMWYPYTSDGTTCTAAKDGASIKERGYLYRYDVLLGFESFDDKELSVYTDAAIEANPSIAQGICPAGWHIPSAKEYYNLCGQGNAPYNTQKTDAIFWDSTLTTPMATVTKAEQAGWNFAFPGCVANSSYNKGIVTSDKADVQSYVGKIAMSYYPSSTYHEFKSNGFKFWAMMSTFTSANKGKLSIADCISKNSSTGAVAGVPVRCVKNN